MAVGQKLRIVLLALLWCAPALLPAAEAQFLPQDLTMRVWTKPQGLPDDSVTAVLPTRDGYLWVGTSAGLARFDGVRFVSFAPAAGKTNAPLNVLALCEDSAGRLWIGTQGEGLLGYMDGTVTRYRADHQALDSTINSIAEDTAGNLWLGAPSGLYCLTGQALTHFTTKDGLPNDFVSSIHVARSGMVWITTKGGMCQFRAGHIFSVPFQTDSPGRNPESLGVYEDRKTNLWAFGDTYLVNLTAGKHLNHFASGDATASMRIWGLCEGRHGELWIGTSGKELYCFVDDKFFPVTLRNGGLTSDVRTLCEDSEGNLWLGTYGGGLVRLQPRNVTVVDASTGLPNRPAVGLAFNAQGRAWFGFERDGLYTGKGENFDRLNGDGGREFQNLISSLGVAPDGNLWVATPGEGIYCAGSQGTVHYTTANGLTDNNITAIAVDFKGVVWLGTATGDLQWIVDGEIKSAGAEAGLPAAPVTAILAAKNGGVWAGFGNGRLFRGENGSFHQVGLRSATAGKMIRSLYEDAAGNLWIGAADGRLACLANERVLTWDLNPISTDDHSISGILSSDDGDLWLGTGTAIYRVAQHDVAALMAGSAALRPQLVYKAEGTAGPAAKYGWPQAARSPDGKLWFGMANAVVSLDLRTPMSNFEPPPVLIEAVVVNEKPLPYAVFKAAPGVTAKDLAPRRLAPNLSSLDIQFTALNLSAPEKIRFRHRLEGIDPDWVVDNDGARKVHYGPLPYGTYAFRVQAGTADESWFEPGASFRFLVPTPVWRTGWALTAYIVFTVIVIASTARLVFNRRLRHKLEVLAAQQAMERERMRIAKDMHDEIGSKLTKISFMSERAKGELQGQDSVARKLHSIAHTSRDLLQTLDEIVWAVNPHNDTLEHLANYLGQYATEYLQNTAVDCELHIPGGLPEHPFSAETRHNIFLAFEEALNNALKHGHATLVRVDMMFEPGQFQIKIVDNGCGFDVAAAGSALPAPEPAPGNRVGNGLRNMSQRLADTGGKCTVTSQPGRGTTVCFTVPLTAATTPGRRR
ncbi:MAG: two-component regulator propeller domain-containing protein [Verrucomicrobiae bacterium]|nr:two-component regulator propeller domain-containing protein [Verrucomicrobiae bacterium]